MTGQFVAEGDQTWYRIDGPDSQPPFFMTLASDSDLWAFISTAGSLTAGRGHAEQAFFPYETVDKIHLRWQHTGPRTWVRWQDEAGLTQLWQPFVPRLLGGVGERSVWKNLSGTRIRLRELHPTGLLAFEYEWAAADGVGLVRSARLWAPGAGAAPRQVQVLDGLLNL